MSFGMISGLGPQNYVTSGWRYPKRKGQLWGNVPDKPNTLWIANWTAWSTQRRAHNRGRRLIASVGQVYYQPRVGGIAHGGRSLISTVAL